MYVTFFTNAGLQSSLPNTLPLFVPGSSVYNARDYASANSLSSRRLTVQLRRATCITSVCGVNSQATTMFARAGYI